MLDDCTFDDISTNNGFCHWHRYYPSRLAFSRWQGPTPTFGTGPDRGYDPTNSSFYGEYRSRNKAMISFIYNPYMDLLLSKRAA